MTLSSESARGAGSKSVLVVDDEPAIGRAIERVLRSAGCDVTIANGAGTAIALLATERFDVIVTDILMPDMNGVDLLRVIRTIDLDVPVILMTGAPTLETAVDAIALGAFRYLMKPFDNAALVDTVLQASRLHRLAKLKRDALWLTGDASVQPSDLAGLGASFENALESLWVAFQPIVDVNAKRIFAYEALMRTREPSLPSPMAVLDAAKRLDRLSELGERVRALAAAQFERAPKDALLFVNLHTHDLLDDALYDPKSPLTKMADRVVLEVTERSSLDSVRDIQARAQLLRNRGFRLAIDDLGAGYAGLSSFGLLEPEFAKLDATLIRDVHRSVVRERLVGSMSSLCAEMNISVIAEGVETADERDCVLQAGCTLHQGFFFAKPAIAFCDVAFA